MTPTVRQIRAARALLDWNQGQLASAAGVALRTVAAMESGEPVSEDSARLIVEALVTAGVTFVNAERRIGLYLDDVRLAGSVS